MVIILKINNKVKKIISIIVIVFFVFAFILPLLAGYLVDAASIQQRKQETQGKINELRKQNKNILEEKKKVDENIKKIEEGIAAIEAEVKEREKQLVQLEAELEAARRAADKQYENLKKRIRVMYEQGADNYLEVLLSAGNLTDFLNRFEIIRQIAEYDNNRFEKLRSSVKEIETKTAQVERVKEEKKAKLAVQEREKNRLNLEQKKRDEMINENNQDVAELEKILNELEAIEARQKAEAAAKMSKDVKYVGGQFEWPAPGYYTITSEFGPRFHPILKTNRVHSGIDIAAPSGASAVAANDGTVIKSAYSSSYGNYIIIDHGGGIATLYAHGSSRLVSEGTKVKRGQAIMKVGSTGYSTGPHLHFEVIVNGSNVNPSSYF